jgi:hypothetical protein
MGRGKSKAKHTKVARRLKYSPLPSTDLTALQAELKGTDMSAEADPDDDELLDDEETEDEDFEDDDLFEDDEELEDEEDFR